MNKETVIRRFNELGRIVIPKAYRKAIGLEYYEGVPMEIWVENDSIIMRPYGIDKAYEEGTAFLNTISELPSSIISYTERDAIRSILQRLHPDQESPS